MFMLPCVTFLLWVPMAAFDLCGSRGDTTVAYWRTADPPTVTSTSPAEGSSGVAVRRALTATFSDAMDPATITVETFTVSGPGKTPVKGTVNFDARSKTATFVPSDALAPGTRYWATITIGARDFAGNGLSGDFAWSFTTTSAPEGPRASLAVEPAFPSDKDAWSYVIPGLEIIAFNVGLNRFDYEFIDRSVYGVTYSSVKFNVTHGWVFDTDPFLVDQLEHPISGALYHGFARSAGLSFWEAFVYDFMGSLMWKYAGETGRPTINDQISTSFGGSFLGEALFRMAHLVLAGGGDDPGFWREVGAAALSPAAAFNRHVFCDRFHAVFPDNDPALFLRLRLGGSLNTKLSDEGVTKNVSRKEAVADISLAYGLPGKPGYTYTRPFDYFDFESTVSCSSNATFYDISTRGLLLGEPYDEGRNYRGVWGLYGSYDYFSQEVFRISSSALSLGSTGQLWMSRTVALQGTVLGGVGFGASGTIAPVGQRDYHYGTIPQALLALRLIFDDVAMFDLTAREYYVTGVGIDKRHGHENIARGQTSFTVRVYGQHALGIQYIASDRDAYYASFPDRHQKIGTISLVYNFLGDTQFGAVEWRNPDGR
jgi:hypothetical protein